MAAAAAAVYPNGVTVNGHGEASANGAGPSTSKVHTPTPAADVAEHAAYENGNEAFLNTAAEHDASIVNHIYQSGFQQGNYADVQLIVLNRSYRLHCLILSRSPYLESLIHTSHNKQIFVPLETFPHITEESFAIALGYLYASTSIALVTPSNARSVLATASLLSGPSMASLQSYAFELAKASISVETIDEWIEFLLSLAPPSQSVSTSSSANGNGGGSSPTTPISGTPGALALNAPLPAHIAPPHLHHAYGGVGPSSPLTSSPIPIPLLPVNGTNGVNRAQTPNGNAISPSAALFGPYGALLKDAVFRFLVVELPETLASSSPAPTDVPQALVDIYARLPFEYFKSAIESPDFPIGNSQERFRFAKSVVAVRKRGVARDSEETVVLAFGGDGAAVHVTRKLRGRRLLKVGGK